MAYDNLNPEEDWRQIHVAEEHEILYWTQTFECTEGQLRDSVKTVGTSAEKVRRHLRGGAMRRLERCADLLAIARMLPPVPDATAYPVRRQEG